MYDLHKITTVVVPKGLEKLNKHCLAAPEIVLKKGAQVMLLKNLDLSKGLVNGVCGKVISFQRESSDGDLLPLIRWKTRSGDLTLVCHKAEFKINKEGNTLACRYQLPLRLVCMMNECNLGMGSDYS